MGILPDELIESLKTETVEGRILRFYPNQNFLADTPERVHQTFWFMLRDRVKTGFYFNDMVPPPTELGMTVEEIEATIKSPREREFLKNYVTQREKLVEEEEAIFRWWEWTQDVIGRNAVNEAIDVLNDCPKEFCCGIWSHQATLALVPEVAVAEQDVELAMSDEEE